MRRFTAIGIGIFVLLIALVLIIGNRGDRPNQDTGVKRQTTLVDYADTGTEVRFTQEGKINARENHRVLQITVGQTQRTATIFDGYEGNMLKTETFLNDPDAYRAFLAGLQNSGFTNTRIASRNVNSLGACPGGLRYHYDIVNGSDSVQSLWSTSCTNVRGTFNGQASSVRSLFQNQLPDYSNFVKGVQF